MLYVYYLGSTIRYQQGVVCLLSRKHYDVLQVMFQGVTALHQPTPCPRECNLHITNCDSQWSTSPSPIFVLPAQARPFIGCGIPCTVESVCMSCRPDSSHNSIPVNCVASRLKCTQEYLSCVQLGLRFKTRMSSQPWAISLKVTYIAHCHDCYCHRWDTFCNHLSGEWIGQYGAYTPWEGRLNILETLSTGTEMLS